LFKEEAETKRILEKGAGLKKSQPCRQANVASKHDAKTAMLQEIQSFAPSHRATTQTPNRTSLAVPQANGNAWGNRQLNSSYWS
jgi:hypothetical protein